jgi:prepilin-type N-terminal cleavage/methylation domain-containing protein
MSEQHAGDCKRLGRFQLSRRSPFDRQPRGDERGFTLIELLVVLVIMPLVIGAISIALISVMKQQNTVSNKVSDSQDTQVVSAVFVQDVQSASQIATPSIKQTAVPCGPTQTWILSLQLGSPQTVVSYDVVKQGSQYALFRYACANGASQTPTSSRIIAYDVQSSLTADIKGLSCSPFAFTPCTAMPAAATSAWAWAAGVSGVTLIINSQSSNYSLTGVPRGSTISSTRTTGSSGGGPSGGGPTGGGPSGGGEPPGHPTALTLGGSGTTISCGGSNNGTLQVNGTLQINSTSSTVASTNNNAAIAADSIDTGSTSTSSLSGNVTPATPSQTGVTVTDPYAGLTPPVTGLQASSPPAVGSIYQGYKVYSGAYSGPGIYTNTLSFPNGTTTMDSGVYILLNGVSQSGQQNVQSATTGGADGKGGVLLYVLGGSVSLTGQGQATLAPFKIPPVAYSGAPNPWPGIVIWQDSSDSANLALAGNGLGNVIDGTVYAPTATAGTQGNGALIAGSIVASGIACGGNGTFIIG